VADWGASRLTSRNHLDQRKVSFDLPFFHRCCQIVF